MDPTKFVPTVTPGGGGVAWVGRFWTMLARAACEGLAILFVGACGAPSTISEPPVTAVEPTIEGATTDLEELHALAKLYGYVRYFHPSDEAAAADWETIAVEGARRIVQGSTRAELLAALREIFQPLAPTLLVFPIEAPPPPAEPPRRGRVVAWQHEGYGLGFGTSVYQSGRTRRPRQLLGQGPGYIILTGSIPADQVRGKRVRLRGWARVDGSHHSEMARLWMRIELPHGDEFYDYTQDRPIRSTHWQAASVESTPVGPEATQVVFGGVAVGAGSVYFDDFTLEVSGPDASTWTEVALDNGDFESGSPFDGWEFEGSGYAVLETGDAHGGEAALKLERLRHKVRRDVFDERASVGETFERDLGAGLACRVVLGLPASKPLEITPTKFEQLPDASDPAVRVAAAIIGWNVLRHFYPYHDVIGEDWEQVLDLVLTDVLDDSGPEDLLLTLRRLVHRLHDGHGHVGGPLKPEVVLPLRLVRIDGVFVVTAAPKDHPLQRGDELVSIDGVSSAELFEQRAAFVSGSPQWIEYVLLHWARITEGSAGTVARVEILRDDVSHVFDLERTPFVNAPEEFDRPYFDTLEPDVLYVDLVRIPEEELAEKMDVIAKAKAVIIDVRGYPQADEGWLRHFLTKPERAKWMFVPRIIRPDFEGVSAFREYGWDLRPASPHVAGKVAFITGPAAISYAESLMGYVEGHRLGPIVGSATAGANGNINQVMLPGAFSIRFTGMKVTRIDGRQHHIVGVQPTHPVERTLAGIRAGRDEELEVALDLVRPIGARQ